MIRFETDPALSSQELNALWQSAWGALKGNYVEKILPRSLCYIGAYSDDRLVGFVNVAWDGDQHAILLDTSVHKDFQRRGIATSLVETAAKTAQARGAVWLHVDFDAHLETFYRGCGFQPALAGLIRLNA